MIGKKYSLLLTILPILLLGLAAINMPVQASPPAYVRIWISPTLHPYVEPGLPKGGSYFTIDIYIELGPGLVYPDPDGIVGWGIYFQVDPAVLEVQVARGGIPGYFLYEFADWEFLPYPVLHTFFNATTGYVAVSEFIAPTPEYGADDFYNGYKLVTIRVESLSDTVPCLLDILNAEYMDASGTWHQIDIIEDGYYGEFIGYPIISNVSRAPVTPNYDEEVMVTATITDNVAVDEALLSHTYDLTWHNVSMNRFDDTFNATIPAQPYGTLVEYMIYANDTGGNWSLSELYSYTVEDFLAPKIAVSLIPAHPMSGQTITVLANVTEPANASGVNPSVFFSYRVNTGPWWNTTMVFNGVLGLYETTIAPQQPNDFVEYYIRAQDNAGNENTTEMYSYVVALAGDIDLDGDVDRYDYGILAQVYGSNEGDPRYIQEADLDIDGDIDRYDYGILAQNYGQSI